MRKLAGIILTILLLFTVAITESVTQMPYSTIVNGETRDGYYTGNIENGIPEGYGIFDCLPDEGFSGNNWHYIGNWHEGLMSGRGSRFWEDGCLEIGDFDNGTFYAGFFCYDEADFTSTGDMAIDRTLSMPFEDTEPEETQYIGNKNSHVFHRLECDSVTDMKEKNKIEFRTREEAEALGYKPCQRCNP